MSLLLTKLSRPQPRPTLIPRPRLRQLLQAADVRPLTLICAPAGYGKTTLILDWLAGCQTVAWLSLDESDNDPVRFWSYVIAALQTVVPGAGDQSLALLPSPQPPSWPLTLTFLLNDLSALSAPCFLVLDDYQTIAYPAIHESLAYFLERLPPAMRLILTSRADPPLPLARLRARGQLLEIRERDLCFTPAETAEFMQQVMGISLTVGQLQSLTARTEGWVAGLQLAGLAAAGAPAVSGAPNAAAILDALSGSQRHLVDYLSEEVLARQPEGVQTFLLQTATLERFCAPLCQAVLGDGDWRIEMAERPPIAAFQALLEYLDRANLFLIPLDNERCWYRYHHLFAGLLRFRAAQALGQAAQRQIHQRAAVWFAGNQLWIEAITHALAAEDRELAGKIIAEQAAAVVARGELASLKEWLAALPRTQLQADSRLCLAQAWVNLFEGQLDTAESWLRPVLARAQSAAEDDDVLLGQALAVRATLAFVRHDADQVMADTQQALALLPASQLPLRTLLCWHLAFTLRSTGQAQQSLAWYYQTIELSRQGGNLLIHFSARRELGSLFLSLGDLSLAQTLLTQLLEEATAKGWGHVPAFAGAHVHLGEIFYEWNALDNAITHLQAALSLPQASEMSFDAYAYALLARAYAGKGDQTAAAAAIQQAMQRAPAAVHPQRRLLTLAQIARFWLAQGDLTRAAAWLPDGRDVPHDPRHEVFARQQITHAHYLLAIGDKAAAAELTATLLPAAAAAGRVRQTVELWLLRAQVSDGAEAEAAMRQALTLAEPAGLLRTFVDAGSPVAALLARLPALAGPYLHRLTAAFSLAVASSANRLLLEPLSERELEVLRLMAEGYSNREIAGKLFFTVATAKKHAEHIYGKLGVNSRTQALARARELGLLS